MTLVQVKIPDDNTILVIELLEKLGCEVREKRTSKEKKINSRKRVKEKKVPVDYLFGKWPDFQIDPRELRKESWTRNK